MTRSCPLPVDWLDYLDGDGLPELAAHLAVCPSCRVLVGSLEGSPAPSVSSDWAAPFAEHLEHVWREDRPKTPALAEFWFSASDVSFHDTALASTGSTAGSFAYNDVDRVLLLVVSHPEQDHGLEWLNVVPVLSDIERATETDLLFTAEENSLGAPWRALFSYQCKVARQQLDTRAGSLWEFGQAALFSALAGEFDDARWGVPLQHPDDPRARLEPELDEALLRLRTPWLLVHDAGRANEPEDKASPRLYLIGAPDVSPPEGPHEFPSSHVFWLQRLSDPSPELALVAASSSVAYGRDLWAFKGPSFELQGTLDVDWDRGALVFFVTAVSLRRAARLRLHLFAAGKPYTSEPFVPAEDAEVELAQGPTKAEVDKLGAELVS
jgi:hypothetical protein